MQGRRPPTEYLDGEKRGGGKQKGPGPSAGSAKRPPPHALKRVLQVVNQEQHVDEQEHVGPHIAVCGHVLDEPLLVRAVGTVGGAPKAATAAAAGHVGRAIVVARQRHKDHRGSDKHLHEAVPAGDEVGVFDYAHAEERRAQIVKGLKDLPALGVRDLRALVHAHGKVLGVHGGDGEDVLVRAHARKVLEHARDVREQLRVLRAAVEHRKLLLPLLFLPRLRALAAAAGLAAAVASVVAVLLLAFFLVRHLLRPQGGELTKGELFGHAVQRAHHICGQPLRLLVVLHDAAQHDRNDKHGHSGEGRHRF